MLALSMLLGCSQTNLKQQITEETANNCSITVLAPEEWVYTSDGDLLIFASSNEEIENDEWYMMLSVSMISTVGDGASLDEITRSAVSKADGSPGVNYDKLSDDVMWVSVTGDELSYFIVKDDKTGLYVYGRTYNAAVDEATSRKIAKKIKLSQKQSVRD